MKKSIFAILMLAATAVSAQERPTHEIHAAMLFNFIKYVQWPNEGESGDFVVGVIGDDNVFNTLNTWYNGKTKGSKKYVIKKLASADESSACQVVYVGKAKSRILKTSKTTLAQNQS